MRRITAGLAIAVASCELALPIHEVSDADALDVSNGDATPDAASDGLVNLLQNPGFEQGSTGCGSFWTAGGGVTSFAISDASRTGGQACRVCANNSSGITQHLNLHFDAGTHFTGDMWAAPVEAGTTSAKMFVVIHVLDAAPNQVYITVNKNNFATWTELTNGVTPTANVDSIDFAANLGPDGGCVLVDDTALFAE